MPVMRFRDGATSGFPSESPSMPRPMATVPCVPSSPIPVYISASISQKAIVLRKTQLVGGFSPRNLKKYAQVKLDHLPR